MNLRRRIERLEKRSARKPEVWGTIVGHTLQSLSDEQLQGYEQYVEERQLGLEPSAEASAAVQCYNAILQTEFRAAGFASREDFERAYQRALDRRTPRAGRTWKDGPVFQTRFWRFWRSPSRTIPQACQSIDRNSGYRTCLIPLPSKHRHRIQSWAVGWNPEVGTPAGKHRRVTVGQLWGFSSGSAFLLDQCLFSGDRARTIDVVRLKATGWAGVNSILLEDTAAGREMADALAGEISRIAVSRDGEDLETAARRANELVRQGAVYLPHPFVVEWAAGFLQEFGSFPGGEDGQVCALVQALRHIGQAEICDLKWPQVTVSSGGRALRK